MPTQLKDRHTVRVRLLSLPCMWCWEIRSEAEGELVESSWVREWMAYDSYEAALKAGEARLAQLVSEGREGGESLAGRKGARPAAGRRRLLQRAG